MIDLELKFAILLYAGVLGLGAILIWLYTEFTLRRPQRYLGKQNLWRCSICGFVCLDDSDDTLSQCPQCESYVAAVDEGARVVPVDSTRNVDAPRAATEPDVPVRKGSKRKRHGTRRGPRRRGGRR